MTDRLTKLRDEIVSAACGWSGALRGQHAYPSGRADRIEAEQRQVLLDAVAAYLADNRDAS